LQTPCSDEGRVFADEVGRPLSPGGVSKLFSRLVKAADLPPLTLHGLRHTFATLGLDAGVDTLYVSELLGHSSPAITMGIYQHTRQERLEGAIRTVGDAIFGR
jgi:integrase